MSYKINNTALNQTLSINTIDTKHYFNSQFVGPIALNNDDIIHFNYNIFNNTTKILEKDKGYLVSDINFVDGKYNFSLHKYENNIWEKINLSSAGAVTYSLNDTYDAASGSQLNFI